MKGYSFINKEDFSSNPLRAKLMLMYKIDQNQFREKFLTAYNIEVSNEEMVDDIVRLIKSGKLKGFNLNQFLKSFKVTSSKILKSKVKIL